MSYGQYFCWIQYPSGYFLFCCFCFFSPFYTLHSAEIHYDVRFINRSNLPYMLTPDDLFLLFFMLKTGFFWWTPRNKNPLNASVKFALQVCCDVIPWKSDIFINYLNKFHLLNQDKMQKRFLDIQTVSLEVSEVPWTSLKVWRAHQIDIRSIKTIYSHVREVVLLSFAVCTLENEKSVVHVKRQRTLF